MSDIPPKLTVLEHLLHHVGILSSFQRRSMVMSFLVGLAGLVGMGVSPKTTPAANVASGAPQSGYVDSSTNGSGTTDANTPDDGTWSYWASHKGAKMGFGFMGGFTIAFAFRAFIKTMAMITAVVVSVLAAMSYFNVLNIDFTSIQHAYTSNSEWIISQATRLKDLAWQHLPSSTAGVAGMFVGITRKS